MKILFIVLWQACVEIDPSIILTIMCPPFTPGCGQACGKWGNRAEIFETKNAAEEFLKTNWLTYDSVQLVDVKAGTVKDIRQIRKTKKVQPKPVEEFSHIELEEVR